MRRTLLVIPFLAAAACDGANPANPCALAQQGSTALPLVAAPAVRVAVVDSVTGLNRAPAARGAFVRDNVADTLHREGTEHLVAGGPAGRYTVVIQVGGYALWARDGVEVRGSDCGVQTVELTARLQPRAVAP